MLAHYQSIRTTNDANTAGFVQTTDWQLLSANSLWQTTAYKETVRSQGVFAADLPAAYDELSDDQKQAYQNALTQSATDITTINIREDIVYSDLGLVQSYKDIATQQGNPTVTTSLWQASGYDAGGLLEGYAQNITISNGGDSRSIISLRSDIIYDSSLRMTGFTDSEAQGNIATIMNTHDIVYSALGNQLTFVKDISRTASGASGSYSITSTVKRTLSNYAGNYLIEYQEEITSSADAALTANHIFGITYDAAGNQSSMITKSTRTGAAAQQEYYIGNDLLSAAALTALLDADTSKGLDDLIEEGTITVKNVTADINNISLSVQWGLKYNGLNLLAESHEMLRDNTSGITTTVAQSNILYDQSGQRVVYDSTVRKQGTAAAQVYCLPDGSELSAASLADILAADSSSTIASLIASGAVVVQAKTIALDDTITSSRSNILYNDIGQMSAYDELNTRGNFTTKSVVTGITYDDKSRESSRQTATYRKDDRTGGEFSFISSVARSAQQYNNMGQLCAYRDTIFEPYLNIDDLARIEDNSVTYDAQGRITLQLITTSYQGRGARTVYSYQGSELKEDQLEDLLASGKSLSQLLTDGTITQSYAAIDTVDTPAVTSLRLVNSYDALGQMLSSCDISTQAGEAGST